MKKNLSSFTSNFGRHNLRSLGKDLGIHDLLREGPKMAGGNIKAEHFARAADPITRTQTLTDVGIRIGAGVAAKMIENGVNSLTNCLNGKTPLITSNGKTPMGKSSATYQTTKAHTGVPTIERLKRIGFNPNIDYDEKILKSSERDYQNHEKRKNLMLRSGFNEKSYTFFMEDTYFTADDYLKLFKNKERIQDMLTSTKTKTDVYGCIYKTKNMFKFINKLDFYNVSLRLHMVKLYDHHKDVRGLLEDITNNKISTNKILTTTKTDMVDDLKKTIVENTKKKTEEIIDKLNIDEKLRKKKNPDPVDIVNADIINKTGSILKEKTENLSKKLLEETFRPNTKYGKILEDNQYSDPNTKDLSNKFNISFLTSINCLLNDSIRFRDEATIVHTWERTLTPGSIWKFNLEHHLGSGVHLNQLYDFDMKNKNHPSGYFFILEQVGDRKGRLIRNIDKDFFSGYSPTQVHVEFDFRIGFLYELKNGVEEACIYRRKKLDQDFEENSYYESLFTPDREPSFHISFDEISFNETNQKEQKKFSLEYDINLMENVGASGLLNRLQADFEKAGLDTTNITEDDKVFNVKKGPTDETEYEGTEGQKIPKLDLDE